MPCKGNAELRMNKFYCIFNVALSQFFFYFPELSWVEFEIIKVCFFFLTDLLRGWFDIDTVIPKFFVQMFTTYMSSKRINYQEFFKLYLPYDLKTSHFPWTKIRVMPSIIHEQVITNEPWMYHADCEYWCFP